MQTGFDNLDVLLRHRAGQPCRLLEGFEWWYRGHKFRHMPGGYTDGMSSPQFTHAVSALEPYGWALPAAVAHDGIYHDAVQQWIEKDGGGEWRRFTFTKSEGDMMLKELLDVLAGADKAKQDLAIVIYEAVRFGGQAAFDLGRSKPGAEVLP